MGNTPWAARVVPLVALNGTEPLATDDQEDPTTTTLMAPNTMSHLEQFADAEWVEPSDELQGTAVFDATGDRAAMPSWDELVRQHADRVYRLAYRLSGNQHDAEDLTQETFIRVYRRLDTYRFGSRFSTWTIQIARNAAIDALRSRERRDRLIDALPPPRPASEPGLGAEIQAALATLTPKLRDALLLVEVAGFTYADAGEVLGIPTGTVKSRVFQARDQLAAWFEADEPAPVGRARRRSPGRRARAVPSTGGEGPTVESLVLAEPPLPTARARATDPDREAR